MEGKNTIFSYMYRDGANYKFGGEVIFKGFRELGLEEKLREALADGENFIARQIGVPDVFPFPEKYSFDEDVDHCWHEFTGLEATSRDATDEKGRSITEFVNEARKIGPAGWIEFDPVELCSFPEPSGGSI